MRRGPSQLATSTNGNSLTLYSREVETHYSREDFWFSQLAYTSYGLLRMSC
eukprot:c39911_g1_i1 orf=115-267(-)